MESQTREAAGRAGSGVVSLFNADPDLFRGISPRAMDVVKSVPVPYYAIHSGPWEPGANNDIFAWLLLDGAMSRETRVPGESSLELLGSGDVVIHPRVEELGAVPTAIVWESLQDTQIAELHWSLMDSLRPAPSVVGVLAKRAGERIQRAAVQMALAGIYPVRRRVELLLWHLADRWGQRKAGGVVIPVRLTQRILATLAATERSTVCRALIELERDDVIEKLPGKHVRLLGSPPGSRLVELAEEQLALQ